MQQKNKNSSLDAAEEILDYSIFNWHEASKKIFSNVMKIRKINPHTEK